MQAITTKYIGPTNSRGARVKATCDAGTITISWDHALNTEGNHDAAALALVRKLGWDAPDRTHVRYKPVMYRGGLKGAGYCYVFPVEWTEVSLVGGAK